MSSSPTIAHSTKHCWHTPQRCHSTQSPRLTPENALWMPFGLKNTFQLSFRLHILTMASKDIQQHKQHLCQLFKKVSKSCDTINFFHLVSCNKHITCLSQPTIKGLQAWSTDSFLLL